MKRVPRILVATAISLTLNILLLILSAGTPGGRPSLFWKAVDVLSKPATLAADALFSSGHSPGGEIFESLMCSIVYYTLVVWAAIALLPLLAKSISRSRTFTRYRTLARPTAFRHHSTMLSSFS
jgi:hypothetical protein